MWKPFRLGLSALLLVASLWSSAQGTPRTVVYPRVLVRTADGGQKVVAVRPKQFEKLFGVKWARYNRFATPADAEAITASQGGPHVAAALIAELDAAERGPRPEPGPRWSSDPALNVHHWPTIKAGRTAPVYIAAVDHPNLPKGQVGVFAERTIRRGELIGLYTGLVTAEKLPDTTYAWNVMGRRARDAAQPSLSMLGLGTTSYRVDGKAERNVLTYVNHAENPNADAYYVFDGKSWAPVYVATRDIKKGEQVLTNYGSGYFKHRGIEPLDLSTLKALPFERAGAN